MTGTVPPSADQAAPGDVRGAVGEQEYDHGGDLLRLREPSERPSGADLREHLLAVPLLVGEPAVADPRGGGGRAGRDRVAADAVLRVQVGDEPREREHRRLHHRVVGHAARRALPRGRGDVDDRAPRLLQRRQRRARGPHRAHQVELERRLPVVVRQVGELADLRRADVVDEPVEPAVRGDRLGDESLRLAAPRQVDDDVQIARPFRAATRRDGDRALRPQLLDDQAADAVGRPRDDAHLPFKPELHGSLR